MTIGDVGEAGRASLGVLADLVRSAARRVQAEIETVAGPVLRAAERLAPRRTLDHPEPMAPFGQPGGGAQEQVEEAKYYVGTPALHPVVDREVGELPRSYGSDRLVLLPRDPWWLFAYWEITAASRVDALRSLGDDAAGAREVLRIYDVTFIEFDGQNAWSWFDVDFAPGAESWYVNVGKPGTSYCAEIGLRTGGGRFVPLVRAVTVQTPPAQPAPEAQVRWATLKPTAGGAPGVAWSGRYVPTDTSSPPGSSDLHTPR